MKSLVLNSDERSRIKVFLSIAVPHSGAILASFGKLILGNPNIEELSPLNPVVDDLTRRWIKAEKPETKYLYGTYDDFVTKESACPPETSESIACEHDHNSITKPSDETETVVKICESALHDFAKKKFIEAELSHKELQNPDEYNQHLYVLKLLISKLTGVVVTQAKTMYYNAEYASRTYSETDSEALLALYNKIKALYVAEFLKLQSGAVKNSAELVANIYEKIRIEDATSLKTALDAVDFFHKTGMLHQLADVEEHQIWWDKDHDMNLIDDYRKKHA
ncbi:MAG: hypothetical protein JNM12_15370 [Alphaproteobacteria bacterium]|nr:hypothetical protein [Alphaproteobacteria bacterium]